MRDRLSWVVLMSVIPLGVLTAQPTVDLFVPPNIADVYAWRVTIHSDSEYAAVQMAGWVRADGELAYACTTHAFPLHPRDTTLTIRTARIWKQWAAGGYKVFLYRSGRLPAKVYTYGVALVQFGSGDSGGPMPVRPMGPPRLIMPRQGDTVKTKAVQFNWTQPAPAYPGVVFDFALYPVLTDQTPDEAVKSNLAWYQERDLRRTSFIYPEKAPALPDTGQFVWQVKARDSTRDSAISEPQVFTMRKGGAKCAPWLTTATIVWQHRPSGAQNWEIWYTDYSNYYYGPTVLAPKLLCSAPGNNMDPAIAYDRTGNTWCVWSRRGPGASQHYAVVWSRRLAGQPDWSPPQVVAAPSIPVFEQVDPAIAFDDNGNGLCVWVEGAITNTNDVMHLRASAWDGSNWSVAAAPGPSNPCRSPEITFTCAQASGSTPHQAMVIAALQNPVDKMGWWAWDGTAWSGCNVLPTTGDAFAAPYTGYIGSLPMPTKYHVTIAALFKNGKPMVTAAWARKTASATTRLMACNGYYSGGTWTWTEFPNWFNGPNGTTYHSPAVAIDGSSLAQSVFVQSTKIYTKNGFGPCQMLTPPSSGRGGGLPRVAWTRGQDAQHSGPLAVWWYGTDINWAFRDGIGNWNQPSPIPDVTPGADISPDVAAPNGSHTMIVQ